MYTPKSELWVSGHGNVTLIDYWDAVINNQRTSFAQVKDNTGLIFNVPQSQVVVLEVPYNYCECCGELFILTIEAKEISPSLWDCFCEECRSERHDAFPFNHNRSK